VSEFVVDASALVEAFAGKDKDDVELRARLAAATCHAPHLVDAEVGGVLRRLVHIGEIGDETARTALRAMNRLIEHRYPHHGQLVNDAWELRHTVSFADALYVALAATLDVPLLTADARLTKAPGLPCRWELVG
jgi:predicted nucleic acid-binding protein